MKWDLFISHASEDKVDFVEPLAAELKRRGIKAWLDSENIALGDSIRQKIDAGLSRSQFGLVIISPEYINKKWTNAELNAIFSKESNHSKVLLPIAHRMAYTEIQNTFPLLADKLFVSSELGISQVADAVEKCIGGKSNKVNSFKLDYIDLEVNPTSCHMCFSFQKVKGKTQFDIDRYLTIAKGAASELINILAELSEERKDNFTLSRPIEHVYEGTDIDVSIDFSLLRHIVSDSKWKAFFFLLHMRDWVINRGIDDNYFSLHFTLNDEWDYWEHKEYNSSEEARQFLLSKKGVFEKIIANVLNNEPGLNVRKVKLSDPVWETDGMPVMGGDSFTMNGIILE
jgi:hypothetical protein